MSEKFLDNCAVPDPFDKSRNIDPAARFCKQDDSPSLDSDHIKGLDPDNVTQEQVPIFQEKFNDLMGASQQCDPMQAGRITQDFTETPNRNVIYQYSKSIEGADEAMTALFSDVVVLDPQGQPFPVPITWASQDRAVAAIIQSNVRKDDSLVVTPIRLPIMSIYSSGFTKDDQRYTYHGAVDYFRRFRPDFKPGITLGNNRNTIFGMTRGIPVNITYELVIWTMYIQEMVQILEQIILKFSPVAYINIQGVNWETIVKLDSIGSNLEVDPGDKAIRVVKFTIGMTLETYISQPIVRKKAVLDEKIDFVSVDEGEIDNIIAKLEIKVEGF